MNPVKSVKDFLNSNNISGIILVALSGGADSVCLLSALLECEAAVSAFHLNHGIRGEEADRDEEFCRSLCNRLGVPFSSERADIPAISAEKGIGIEEAARNVRYDKLNREATRINADYIATAHNADDNVETVIFNLVRGCSPDGLCGIPKIRGNIIRPLLDSTREEIEEYLCKKGLSFVTDSTNSDIAYTRNKIRHSVLPVLRSINPAISASVARMCESIRDDKAYFESS
ncbi:MAG: tRNA lysidine(34) synthetase TilS, partial [Clostridia bacterium]|nr:tRNA lysidine(34) synthetase TilS [Clostridia bacterium]